MIARLISVKYKFRHASCFQRRQAWEAKNLGGKVFEALGGPVMNSWEVEEESKGRSAGSKEVVGGNSKLTRSVQE